jgi:hypothetical protein
MNINDIKIKFRVGSAMKIHHERELSRVFLKNMNSYGI